jgi:hypothetical protein
LIGTPYQVSNSGLGNCIAAEATAHYARYNAIVPDPNGHLARRTRS